MQQVSLKQNLAMGFIGDKLYKPIQKGEIFCHCERSEVIQTCNPLKELDCHAAYGDSQ